MSGFVPPLEEKFKTTAQVELCKEQFRYLKDKTNPAELKDEEDA